MKVFLGDTAYSLLMWKQGEVLFSAAVAGELM